MTSHYAYTPLIWPSLLTVFLVLGLALYGTRRRNIPGVLPFIIASILVAAWAASSVMEYLAVDLATKIIWVKLESIWQLPSAVAITCFILEYAWPGRWLSRRNVVLLSIAPLIVLALILTDPLHHWVWVSFTLNGSIAPQLGLGGWLAILYSFVLVFINFSVLIWLFIHSPQHRWPVVIMIAGHIGFRALFVLEKVNYFQTDLPVDVLGVAYLAGMYSIALFGFRIFDPIRLAEQTVINQMQDGVVVLDPEKRVASSNPVATKIFAKQGKDIQGVSLQELLPTLSDLSNYVSSEVEVGTDKQYFELNLSELNDFRGLSVGYLLLLHNVTEKKQAQAQILEQQRALATLNEREKLARELHDELSQELNYINVQAQTVDDLLADGKVEQASTQLHLLAQIARETQVDVRGQISKLSLDIYQQDGFVDMLQSFTAEFERMYGIPTEVVLPSDTAEICLEPTTEVQLLRITQEAFTNIRKHACAKSIQISLDRNLHHARLTIQDDGAGFIPRKTSTGRRTFGMQIMSERAAEIGGSLQVESSPGQGTRVVVEVPIKGGF